MKLGQTPPLMCPRPEESHRQAEVRLAVRLPGEIDFKYCAVPVAELMSDYLAPLPRDRELSFMGSSQQRALEMKARREQIAAGIAEILTKELIKMFGAKDTINGYTQEEWKSLNRS